MVTLLIITHDFCRACLMGVEFGDHMAKLFKYKTHFRFFDSYYYYFKPYNYYYLSKRE